jgi:LEA14-like dessication related protein
MVTDVYSARGIGARLAAHRISAHPGLLSLQRIAGDAQGGSPMRLLALLIASTWILGGCAGMQQADPPRVTVVDVEPAESQGLEARMLLKLRVQNPNQVPIDFNGVSLELTVLDKSFASGVSNQSGTVPAFGETVIAVPVSISVLGLLGHAMGMMGGKSVDKINYEMRGKLNSTNSGSLHFKSHGELSLPGS